MTFSGELETFIRARYPVILVLTAEENRALGLISEVATRRGKVVFEWSHTAGIVPAGTSIQSQKNRSPGTRDPLAALDHVIEHIEPAVFIFKDLHPFLTRQHPACIRKLKDIALQLKHGPKTLVLVGAVGEVPVELEKEIAVLPLPLPGEEELAVMLDEIVTEVSQAQGVALDSDPASRAALIRGALGLTLGEAENVFARILVRGGRLGAADLADVLAEKQQIIRRNGLLEYCPARESLAEVGGLEHLKGWLRQRSAGFSTGARRFGLPVPRGLLLVGVQGCGKSLCARAVAAEWHLPLLRFDLGRLFNSFIGSSEENVRRAIAVAESVAPAVLWVDEVDKAFAGAAGGGAGDGGTAARVLGTLLTWLSDKTAPVFVVATANDITHLPPELLRKGRLDEIFFIDLPGSAERSEILAIHLARRGRRAVDFDVDRMALAAVGFSGAELEEAVNSALFEAFHAGEELATRHVLGAIGQTIPLSRTMEEQVSRLRQWGVGRARLAAPGGR